MNVSYTDLVKTMERVWITEGPMSVDVWKDGKDNTVVMVRYQS